MGSPKSSCRHSIERCRISKKNTKKNSVRRGAVATSDRSIFFCSDVAVEPVQFRWFLFFFLVFISFFLNEFFIVLFTELNPKFTNKSDHFSERNQFNPSKWKWHFLKNFPAFSLERGSASWGSSKVATDFTNKSKKKLPHVVHVPWPSRRRRRRRSNWKLQKIPSTAFIERSKKKIREKKEQKKTNASTRPLSLPHFQKFICWWK